MILVEWMIIFFVLFYFSINYRLGVVINILKVYVMWLSLYLFFFIKIKGGELFFFVLEYFIFKNIFGFFEFLLILRKVFILFCLV